MVERVYQRQARLTDGISLDVSPMREIVRTQDRVTSALDSMAQFVYKDMTTRAEMAGKQYGVTKRPTVQQISDAVRKGEDPSTYFQEGGTVFGDAAREAQAEMFRQDLEFDVTNQINAVATAIDSGVPVDDPEQFAQEIQTMIDGYSNTLAKISPIQTLKFQAGMTAEGNKLYNKVLKVYQDNVLAEHQLEINRQIDQYGTDLYDLLMETDGDIVTSEAFMTKRYQMIEDYLNRVPGNKLQNSEAFQEMITLTYKKAMIDYTINRSAEFVPEDSNLIAEIRRGNVGKLSPLYNTLSPKQKDQFEDDLIKSMNRYRDIQKGQQDQLEAEHKKAIQGINLKVARGEMTGMQAIQERARLGIDTSAAEMKSYLSPNVDTQDNTYQASKLERKIRLGEAGISDIEDAYRLGRINTTQYSQLNEKYTNNIMNLNSGIRLIKNGLGIDEYTDYNLIPKLKQERIDTLSKQLVDEARQAFVEGKPFNQSEVVQRLLNENKTSESQSNVDESLSILKGLLPEGTVITEENYDLFDTAEELDKLGFNKDTRDKILTEIRLLKNALETR